MAELGGGGDGPFFGLWVPRRPRRHPRRVNRAGAARAVWIRAEMQTGP